MLEHEKQQLTCLAACRCTSMSCFSLSISALVSPAFLSSSFMSASAAMLDTVNSPTDMARTPGLPPREGRSPGLLSYTCCAKRLRCLNRLLGTAWDLAAMLVTLLAGDIIVRTSLEAVHESNEPPRPSTAALGLHTSQQCQQQQAADTTPAELRSPSWLSSDQQLRHMQAVCIGMASALRSGCPALYPIMPLLPRWTSEA